MIIKDKPVSDIDVNSSDKERERLRMHKGLSKDTFQKKRLTNLYHPPGTYSPVKRTKQYTDASKEKGRNMVREEGSSVPDTMIDSSLTGKTNQEVDWSPDTNTNSKYFQPSGTGLSRTDTSSNIVQLADDTLALTSQAVEKLKSNIEMVSKDHSRNMGGTHKKSP